QVAAAAHAEPWDTLGIEVDEAALATGASSSRGSSCASRTGRRSTRRWPMRFRRRARRGTRPHLDPADGLYSIIDDRGLPTKGKHPAGVVRQYCGNRVCNQSGDCDRQWRSARRSGAPAGIVLADAGYGNDTALREAVSELGLDYAMGIR
ncbi:transposase, partial [Burkholderia glumae]